MMEVTLKLSDPVLIQSMNTISHILLFFNLATGRSVVKSLTKYNSNNWRKMMREEKEPIDIEFSEQKANPEMF